MQYVISLAVGIMVGVIYALLHVKSPAPPIVALVGLLGMVIGEAGTSFVSKHFENTSKAPQAMEKQASPVAKPPLARVAAVKQSEETGPSTL